MADRRTSLRFEIVGRLRGSVAVDELVRVHNVSPGGALIEVPWAPAVDTRYHVRLESDRDLASVDARVCHVRQAFSGARYLVGLQFIGAAADLPVPEVERLLARNYSETGDAERV